MLFNTTVRLFAGTFTALGSNLGGFLKICWAWCALLVILQFLAIAQLSGRQSGVIGRHDVPALWQALSIPSAVLFVAAIVSIAVAWHRCLLLGEAPSGPHLRFWKREFKFAVRGLLVILLCIPLLAIAMTVLVIWQPSSIIEVLLLSVVLNLLLLPFMLRMSMMLPAIAIDQPLTIGEAFTDSEGLGLPMAIVTMVISTGASIISYAFDYLIALFALPTVGVPYLTILLDFAVGLISMALAIGVITRGYEIVRERQIAEKERLPNPRAETA